MARDPKPLNKKDVDKHLRLISEWAVNSKGTILSRTLLLPSFISALAFVAKIAVHAEVLQHHPDIELSYGKVKIKLTTHDAKGLTKADFELAKRIDNLRLS